MPRDYAKRSSARKPKAQAQRPRPRKASRPASATGARRSSPRAIATIPFSAPSFAAGVVFGAAVVLSVPYLGELLETPEPDGSAGIEAPPPRVVFDFDDRLSRSVVLTDTDAYPVEFEDPEGDASASYLLQAASFESFAEAADLQARLAAQDLPATVSRVTVKERPWYRVTVGPFSRQKDAQRAMTRLRENNLAPLPLKRG